MYVRTKDNKIFEIDEKGCIKEFTICNEKKLFAFKDKEYAYRFENGKEIIKQSDILDDLCDGFLFKDTCANELHLVDQDSGISVLGCALFEETVRGFVETEQGLIYVCKYEKGKFVLM